MSIEVKGANRLADLAKALKEAGRKDLQREMGQAINRAVRPIREDLKRSARENLPSRGGLAAKAARSKIVTRRRTGQRTAGVRIVGTGRSLSLYHLDQGIVRHWGKRGATVQRIKPGWWTEPTEAAAPEVREELTRAMDAIARKLRA